MDELREAAGVLADEAQHARTQIEGFSGLPSAAQLEALQKAIDRVQHVSTECRRQWTAGRKKKRKSSAQCGLAKPTTSTPAEDGTGAPTWRLPCTGGLLACRQDERKDVVAVPCIQPAR
jgi:hypothetical protein